LTTEPVAEHDGPSEATTARRRPSTPIRLCPPQVVPISEEDYHQAVTALVTMIASWWREQHDLHNDDTDAGQ
jgi:hypothetical protein